MTIVFTSLVCVATMAFSVYVPHTRGFFNIGETIIYTTALLFGPFIGAFAGGVGSMVADIFLGYPYYAPATLIIKACEGGQSKNIAPGNRGFSIHCGHILMKRPCSFSDRNDRKDSISNSSFSGGNITNVDRAYFFGIQDSP